MVNQSTCAVCGERAPDDIDACSMECLGINIPIWKTMEEKRLREAYSNTKRNSYSERLNGCECARWENHEGRCQSAYCYCH
jgi:predicted nucleic acid-binding Zn ribbon protein